MRLFARREGIPADVVARAGLPRGESALAHARAADSTWLLGTRRSLVVVPADGAARRIPWEQVEDAAWDQDTSRLRLTEIGVYGEQRPTYSFEMEDPANLLQLVRERVTASIVLQRWVPVRGRQGVTVIGRRSPVGGAVTWMHAYDAGLDPHDPPVAAAAEQALAAARAEVGEPGTDPI
ncbi:MAG: hypothetical protein JWQ67_2806 [Marmoricola sp.]|nr:hypothetical protein [Marmoricola sp.]